ncbi:hypothetical protein [Streptomyces sp. NPDC050485]|uniref:hypothetical protein n=1 Tax=Streptomyces sp. NPDC050485 TaxID=3365617 RepID=UPI0037BB766E
MPVKIERTEPQFAELITAIQSDPEPVAAGIKSRVTTAQSDAEVVMTSHPGPAVAHSVRS